MSGIGFLGGGAIIKQGMDIRGLTSSQFLSQNLIELQLQGHCGQRQALGWQQVTFLIRSDFSICAAVGYWYAAVMGTVFILFVLVVFKRLEDLYWNFRTRSLQKVNLLTARRKFFQGGERGQQHGRKNTQSDGNESRPDKLNVAAFLNSVVIVLQKKRRTRGCRCR